MQIPNSPENGYAVSSKTVSSKSVRKSVHIYITRVAGAVDTEDTLFSCVIDTVGELITYVVDTVGN